MDVVDDRASLVVGVGMLRIEDLGFIEKLTMEAKDLLILGVHLVLHAMKLLSRCQAREVLVFVEFEGGLEKRK